MPADSAWNVSLTEWNTVVESVVEKKKKKKEKKITKKTKLKKKKRKKDHKTNNFWTVNFCLVKKRQSYRASDVELFMEGKDTFTKQNKNIGMHSMPELLFLS